MKFFGRKSIKYFIEKHFTENPIEVKDKVFIDIPAGNGVTSKLLKDLGAKVEAYDLFPKFFSVDGLECHFADLGQTLPIQNNYTDAVICQEGVEHLSDQFRMFQELNRILKKNGVLYITTPNYSNLRSKLSYFWSESEYFYKIMPPNEFDSVWFSETSSSQIYFGHIFLLGIQKLRVLAALSGFRIKKTHHLRVNMTSLFLFILNYPFILLVNSLAYWRASAKRKKEGISSEIYKEVYKLSISPGILISGHLFVEFEKIKDTSEINSESFNKYKSFNIVT